MYWTLIIGLVLLIDQSNACTPPTFSSLPVQSNFSSHHFLGIWYKIEWFTNEPYDEFEKWLDFTQSFEFDYNSSQRLLVATRARFMQDEKCFSFGPWLLITNGSAKMTLKKKDLNSTTNLNWPYHILKTDYDHYALIYACMSDNYIFDEHCEEEMVWLFSRTIVLSDQYLDELHDYIENALCINLTKLEVTEHGDKSCYLNSAMGLKLNSMNIILYFILLILYLFLIYK